MTKSFYVDAKRVGIVSENDVNLLLDPSGAEDLHHSSYMGGLYDSTDLTYATFDAATQASIESRGPVFETFQHLGDNFDHDITLRDIGSGSVKIYLVDDDTVGDTAIVDAHNLLYASTEFPNGVTNTVAGNAEYNPLDDLTNCGVIGTDLRGYAVIVEIKAQGAAHYQWIIFRNAKIDFSIDQIAAKKGTTGTLKWSDARAVSVTNSATSFVNVV